MDQTLGPLSVAANSDVRSFVQAANRRIAETLLFCNQGKGDSRGPLQQKSVAVICAGELWLRGGAEDCRALIPG